MKVGVIGLGRMGSAIAYRLVQAGHTVVGFDVDTQSHQDAREQGVILVNDIKEVAERARVFWLMVPEGKPVDQSIESLNAHAQPGDILIDGGNSHYASSIRRHTLLEGKGIHFLDCGVSGGIAGKKTGYCLMVGGKPVVYETVLPLLHAVAAPNGVAFVGPPGAGHYVKMIHNGIEYALLQAYAEGFHLLKNGTYPDLDLSQIADVWLHGSVIRSWILKLAGRVFSADQDLKDVSGYIGENKTGRWTLEEAEKQHIPFYLLKVALATRTWSRQTGGDYATKVIAMLRNQFGGHAVKKTS